VNKEEWDQVLRVNLTVLFLLSRKAEKVIMRSNRGRIINIASFGGLVGFLRQIAYYVRKSDSPSD
jgi:NAD(P)-dependent dehydrogenase (short-subunit alcohol dehydrogenase family)